ncbi:hypothetical protein OG949_41295 (plasmid) [Streptomyces scopuliridis]|uniref:hypothetical protein n=1 Tax=Streptomyces scopuliridis TaxID=452529 RepID=UPI002DDA4F8C|nr:hypothetical protein [Streptomyces scopuliridis]WSB39179.1 hypothetical protein OG949_41295 [Streptomyces scopuliridis]
MTAAPLTHIDRVSASAGIAQPALQQIQDLTADNVDAVELATTLRELIEDNAPPGGFMPAITQLLTVAARQAEQTEPERALAPQGDPA